jgi:hypothetical protein
MARFISAANQIGSLAVGKNADLIVMKGDPATRISDIENVETVFKDGVGYDTKKLLESIASTLSSTATASPMSNLRGCMTKNFSRSNTDLL